MNPSGIFLDLTKAYDVLIYISSRQLARYLPIKSRLSVRVWSAVSTATSEIWSGVIKIMFIFVSFAWIPTNVCRIVNESDCPHSLGTDWRDVLKILILTQYVGRNASWYSSQPVRWSRNCTPFVEPEHSAPCLQQNTARHTNRHYTFTNTRNRGISSTLLLLLASPILFSSLSGPQNT
jgi:hypothetical protein